MRGLHWFRADLRINDNSALIEAMKQCDVLFAVFIITPTSWQAHDDSAAKIDFILRNLASLSKDLEKKNIPLLIKTTSHFDDCPKLLKELCQQHKIDTLFFNKQYEVNEVKRDQSVADLLETKVISIDDQCVIAPGDILNQQQSPYKVFTPFKKTWLQIADDCLAWQTQAMPSKSFSNDVSPDSVPSSVKHFECQQDVSQWPAGEHAAQQRLEQFIDEQIQQYKDKRDFPSLPFTSQLSAYLAQGVISPRQCIQAVLKAHSRQHLSSIQSIQGPKVWIDELVWREFYKQIMYFFPRVCRHKAFQKDTDRLPWRNDKSLFKAWCEGRTGVPLVDAAMRQLNQTAWMHNRLRMVVAMFLSKSLFLDWRLGEQYFMQHLIDGDLASNNGGWQWSASTGTDAAPYFRIFNPITQSERFDKDGHFIRQYCPELKQLDNKQIHDPYNRGVNPGDIDYPTVIVDIKSMHKQVIEIFKNPCANL